MSEQGQGAVIGMGRMRSRPAGRMFSARIGRFEDQGDRQVMDGLAAWVEDIYGEELRARCSKHVYVRTLPAEVVARIDRLRDSGVILSAIREQFAADAVVTPMKQTDELYISHYNKDYGGDHGLFAKHYDGNLRFMPMGAVVRALIYLQSDPTYKVVFGNSQVEKAFESYDFGLLDFHRELHWVEGSYSPEDRQRILLKCNYLVAPRNAVWITRGLLAANTAIFFVVKAAMEYSKSPRNLPQYAVGYLCNAMRLLNNIHPVAPFLLIIATLAAAAWGISRL